MSKLNFNEHGVPMSPNSNAAMAQVGWLGWSGTVYGFDTPITEIHKTEPASYAPLYMQIGTWAQTDDGHLYVEQD